MNQWLTGLAGVGLGSIIAAIIAGLFSKKKLSAEATKIITDAASGVVEIQKAELARVLASNTLLIGKVDAQQIQIDAQQTDLEEVRREVRVQTEQIAIHAFWDTQAVGIAREHGIELPPPPPLTTGS